jgi:tRNA (guanine37-N1)-methyltransferase
MKFSIVTLFPEMFEKVVDMSILGRGQKKGLLEFEFINLRDFGIGKHKVVDGTTYGGGVGLVFRADVLKAALLSIQRLKNNRVILTSASGVTYTQAKAKELTKIDHLIIICGHYEGVDQRFIDKYVDEEISIGNYVLTGGEIPAMVIADSISRLVSGVIEKAEAVADESFENGLLEYPHYTKPAVFEDLTVPEVLISGHHGKVGEWRQNEKIKKTAKNNPKLS